MSWGSPECIYIYICAYIWLLVKVTAEGTDKVSELCVSHPSPAWPYKDGFPLPLGLESTPVGSIEMNISRLVRSLSVMDHALLNIYNYKREECEVEQIMSWDFVYHSFCNKQGFLKAVRPKRTLFQLAFSLMISQTSIFFHEAQNENCWRIFAT